jgi:hypothetical protein
MYYDNRLLKHPYLESDPIFQALKSKIAGFVREQEIAKQDKTYRIDKENLK